MGPAESFEFHVNKDFSILNKIVCNLGKPSKKFKLQTLPKRTPSKKPDGYLVFLIYKKESK